MRVLVTWGTKMGGTEGVARTIAEALEREGLDVTVAPASRVRVIGGHDAVIVGGALYANRWHRDARRFVARNVAALRRVPVWFFSSGPLDDSADHASIAPTTQVSVLMERVGARGHATFGGRLAPDAKGFPASAMAKEHSGDWRNPERATTWAVGIARALADPRPGIPHEPRGRSALRLLAYGIGGWAACAAIMATFMQVASTGIAVAVHAVLAPLVFVALSVRYFRVRGAREPAAAALTFVSLVTLLNAALAAVPEARGFITFGGIGATWVPLVLLGLTTWVTGLLVSTMPWPKPKEVRSRRPA